MNTMNELVNEYFCAVIVLLIVWMILYLILDIAKFKELTKINGQLMKINEHVTYIQAHTGTISSNVNNIRYTSINELKKQLKNITNYAQYDCKIYKLLKGNKK